MKKTAYIITSLMLAGLLAGCGTSKTETTEAATEAAETTAAETTVQETETTEAETTAEETTAAETAAEAKNEDFSYADLSLTEFEFSSGVGGWDTSLMINEDGSFSGIYHDDDLGDSDDDYPNGTTYICSFEGQFGKLTKVDDLTYSTTLDSISYEKEPENTEIIDGRRYIYTDAYGLDDPETIYFYLPGTKIADLPEDFMVWAQYSIEDGADELGFVGLYNEKAAEGFTSYSKVESFLYYYENSSSDYDDYLTEQLNNASDQSGMNLAASDRYNFWDDELNEAWSILTVLESDSDMEKLRTEEKQWIKDRDAAMEKAGKEVEGGSMQAMSEAIAGADATKERVGVLVDIIRSLYNN